MPRDHWLKPRASWTLSGSISKTCRLLLSRGSAY